jgi:hypothetical protein
MHADADSVRGGREMGGRERGDIPEDELPKKKKEVSAPKPALAKVCDMCTCVRVRGGGGRRKKRSVSLSMLYSSTTSVR